MENSRGNDAASLASKVERRRARSRIFGDDGEDILVGHYRVLRKLGSGAMGAVYRAESLEDGREFALKLLHRGSPEALRRLLREGRALTRLRHPNVVAIHELGESDEQAFLVMEFVDGQRLDEWLAGRPGFEDICGVFAGAALGLSAAHEAGILHRDFKPHNVLVDSAGQARIVDFGIATSSPSDALSSGIHFTPMTAPGTVLGTPRYMAPEQFRCEPCDARTDQFAFCVVLHEALLGTHPLTRGAFPGLVDTKNEKPAPERSREELPAPLLEALDRGLQEAPDERNTSMRALFDALAACLPG